MSKGDVDEWRAWSRAAPAEQLPLFAQEEEEDGWGPELYFCLLCGMDCHDTHEHLELEAKGCIKLARGGWVRVHYNEE